LFGPQLFGGVISEYRITQKAIIDQFHGEREKQLEERNKAVTQLLQGVTDNNGLKKVRDELHSERAGALAYLEQDKRESLQSAEAFIARLEKEENDKVIMGKSGSAPKTASRPLGITDTLKRTKGDDNKEKEKREKQVQEFKAELKRLCKIRTQSDMDLLGAPPLDMRSRSSTTGATRITPAESVPEKEKQKPEVKETWADFLKTAPAPAALPAPSLSRQQTAPDILPSPKFKSTRSPLVEQSKAPTAKQPSGLSLSSIVTPTSRSSAPGQ